MSDLKPRLKKLLDGNHDLSESQLEDIEEAIDAVVSNDWKELLARKIAKDILDCGADLGQRPYRIQFMGGEFQKEWGMGGLAEHALINLIVRSLGD